MFKALTPLIGIVVAVGLFFTYVRPTFEDIKGIQDETAQYAQAIEKASELRQRINELKQRQSSIPLADLERLEAMLPDRVEEVMVLLDLDVLATMHRLVLGDIKVGAEANTAPAGQNPPEDFEQSADETALLEDPDAALRRQYTTLDMSFSVSGAYNDFRAFLEELERSLVLMEITKITFEKSEGDAVPFTVAIRLYSLNPPAS